MKKTIITVSVLLGMALSASAISLSDSKLTTSTPAASTSLTSIENFGNFTITATLTGDTFSKLATDTATASTAAVGFFSVTSDSGKIVGAKTGWTSDGTSIKTSGIYASHSMTVANGAGSTAGYNSYTSVDGASSTNITNVLGNIDMTKVAGIALTMSYTLNGAADLYLTIDYVDANTATATYCGHVNSIYWPTAFNDPATLNVNTAEVSSIYMFQGLASQEQAIALNKAAITASIPEPATATLSLLALAGLAARRRRK